mgnify:CR=1 FL=1
MKKKVDVIFLSCFFPVTAQRDLDQRCIGRQLTLDGKQALADKYLDLFCAKSKTEKKYVQKWMPIVAASQSVKGKPEERDFLHSWTNVVDYE